MDGGQNVGTRLVRHLGIYPHGQTASRQERPSRSKHSVVLKLILLVVVFGLLPSTSRYIFAYNRKPLQQSQAMPHNLVTQVSGLSRRETKTEA